MNKVLFFVFFLPFSFSAISSSVDAHYLLDSTWTVSSVNVNNNSERTSHYQFNDERLKGRVIKFSKDKLTSNLPEEISCKNPVFTQSQSGMDKLINQAMGGSANTKSYELGIDGNKIITEFTLTCRSGTFGGADTGKNSWIAFDNNKLIFINWYDGTILSLMPVNNKSKFSPSFSCEKTLSTSEKSICSDLNLSSFDRSVNSLWKSVKDEMVSVGDKSQESKLMISQREWLKSRNTCGADKLCLEKSMKDRLETLSLMASE